MPPKSTPAAQENGTDRSGRAPRNSLASRCSTPTVAALAIDHDDKVKYDAANKVSKRVRASLSGHHNRGDHISITNPEDVAQKYLDDKKCNNCISQSICCYTEKDDLKKCVSCKESGIRCVLLGREKIKITKTRSSKNAETTTTKATDTDNPENAPVNAPDGPVSETGDGEHEVENVEYPQRNEEAPTNTEKDAESNGADAFQPGTELATDGAIVEVPRENASLVGQLCELSTDIDKMLALNVHLLSLSQNLAGRVQGLEYAELTGNTDQLKDTNELESWAKKSAEFETSIRVQMEEQVGILAKKRADLKEMNLKIASLAGTQKIELHERSQHLERMKKDLENLERDHEKRIEKLEREMGKEAEQLSVVLRGKAEAAQNKRKASLGNDTTSSTKRTKAD